jgi:cysteinyl-tRNA synthetase
MARAFRIYNTLSRRSEEFQPVEPGKIGIYVCGMTVYDDVHVGHARAMVIFDSFVRHLRSVGWEVNFVRNFTDVDDKIIRRANDLGEEPLALAQRYIDRFHRDVDGLGLLRPDSEPRVSTCIGDIQDVIGRLIEKGHAYVSEGTVWFAVKTSAAYGQLSGQNVDELRSPDEVAGKRHSADFALWKAVKPGEPSWESPWGDGRPGWHIECSAMAHKEIGTNVDIHGGGIDLVFPHHENEIAQSECAQDCKYVNYWMHNGMLTMSSGQKMGKSLGNVIPLWEALEKFPAEALRLYYLQSHYRSPLPWSAEALPDALGMLGRLYDALETGQSFGGQGNPDEIASQMGDDAKALLELGRGFAERYNAALDDDFNTARGLGFLFEVARAINRFSGHKKARKRGGPVVAPALEAFQLVGKTIGLMNLPVDDFHAEVKRKRLQVLGVSEAEVEAALVERAQARQDKDWAKADAMRDKLESMNIVVMDGPEGPIWRVKLRGDATE